MRTTEKQLREGKPTIDDMRQDLAEQEADNLQHSDIMELLLNGFEGLENMEDIDIRDEWNTLFFNENPDKQGTNIALAKYEREQSK